MSTQVRDFQPAPHEANGGEVTEIPANLVFCSGFYDLLKIKGSALR